MKRIFTIFKIYKVVTNWFDVLLVRTGLKDKVAAKFKNDFIFTTQRSNWGEFTSYVNFFYQFPGSYIKNDVLSIKHQGQPINFKLSKYTLGSVIEIFKEDPYGKFLTARDIQGKTVIDIGGFIGDTAIYFAIKGAKRVMSFEPYPYSYKLGVENIKLNNLQDKCQLINKGVGGNVSRVLLPEEYKNPTHSQLNNFKSGTDVEITTLNNIIKNLGDGNANNLILKIDCEGCEYDIIENASLETLKKFKFILMEYHKGIGSLPSELRKVGFSVKCSKKERVMENLNFTLGYIFAVRN